MNNLNADARAVSMTATQAQTLLETNLRAAVRRMNALDGKPLPEALHGMAAHRGAMMLHGGSGTGKSDTVYKAVRAVWGDYTTAPDYSADAVLIDFRGVTVEAPDVAGWYIPDTSTGTTRRLPADWLPKDTDKTFIVFCDEWTQADDTVQAAMFGLVRDGRVGEYTLPTHRVVFVFAGNEAEDMTLHNDVLAPLAGRIRSHVRVVPQIDSVLEYFERKDAHAAVRSWLRLNPETLVMSADAGQYAQVNPRTWLEYVSDTCHDLDAQRIHLQTVALSQTSDTVTDLMLLQSHLGHALGARFTAHLRIYRDLPDWHQIVTTPDTATVPADTAAQHALAAVAVKLIDVHNVDAVYSYFQRGVDAGVIHRSIVVFAMRGAHRQTPEIADTSTWAQFATQYKLDA